MPPSGTQFAIAAGGYEAVVTESGAALRSLVFDGRPLIDGFAEDEMASGGRGQVLMPWPNRIRDGRYTFAGKEQQLPLTEPKRSNASHGLVRWAAWTVVQHDADRIELGYRLPAQTGYPWLLDLRISYALSVDGLLVTQSATNLGDQRAPYASGAHPYLVADASGRCDEWELDLPARTRLLLDEERLLPLTREAFEQRGRIGDRVFNHPLTDLERDAEGHATTTITSPEGTGVEVWVDQHHRWLQVYTGDDTGTPRVSVAVEPMTAPPDAFNSGDDLVVIQPGETFSASWGVRAR